MMRALVRLYGCYKSLHSSLLPPPSTAPMQHGAACALAAALHGQAERECARSDSHGAARAGAG